MSQSICLRCLARPLISIEQSSLRQLSSTFTQTATFSTTSSLAANPPKKKGAVPGAKTGPKKSVSGTSYRQGKQGGSKQVRAQGGRPPAAGERKALRKRIVLSNTNALEVAGLEDLSADLPTEDKHAQVLGFSNEVVDSMRAIEGFKATQGWNMFRRPATLVRRETLELAKNVQDIEDSESTVRRVIYGEKGSGKSVLTLQAMAMGFLKGWIVFHIPEAQELVIGHTSYIPTKTTSGETIYIQPHLTASLLAAFAKANHAVLSTLRLTKDHNLQIPIQSNISLLRFAELGAQDPDLAWPVYNALFTELLTPSSSSDANANAKEGTTRPPVLFALDGLSHVMRFSTYLSADATPVHAHDLALVRHFNSLLSGSTAMPNGGMVLATDSSSNRPFVPALDFAIKRNAERSLQSRSGAASWPAHKAIDERVLDVLEDVEPWQIKGLSKEEAKGIMEYYAKSGMLRQTVNQKLVGEKWTLAGGGIVGELERGSVLMRL